MIFWGLVIKLSSILQEKKKQKLENEKQISQRLRIQPKKMIIIVSNLFLNCIYINVLYICLSWVVKAMYV